MMPFIPHSTVFEFLETLEGWEKRNDLCIEVPYRCNLNSGSSGTRTRHLEI